MTNSCPVEPEIIRRTELLVPLYRIIATHSLITFTFKGVTKCSYDSVYLVQSLRVDTLVDFE